MQSKVEHINVINDLISVFFIRIISFLCVFTGAVYSDEQVKTIAKVVNKEVILIDSFGYC